MSADSPNDSNLQALHTFQNLTGVLNQIAPQRSENENSANSQNTNNLLRQSTLAEKRILAHLMYSGEQENEKELQRKKLRNKQMKKKNQKQSKKSETEDPRENFDVERNLRKILGEDYKPVKSKKKRKKRRNKKKKQQQRQESPPPVNIVKTVEERSFCTAEASESARSSNRLSVKVNKPRLNCTINGSLARAGFTIPEFHLNFEAGQLEGRDPQNVVVLSNVDKESLYGFCYHSEEFGVFCYPESVDSQIWAFLECWRKLQDPTASLTDESEPSKPVENITEDREDAASEEDLKEEFVTAEEKENNEENDEEVEKVDEPQDRDEDDEEDDDEDAGQMIEFGHGGTYYLSDIGLHIHSFETGKNDLAYTLSRESNPTTNLISYVSKAHPTFLKKYPNILNSNLVIVNCNYLMDVADRAESTLVWSDLESFVTSQTEKTRFVLSSFDGRYTHEEIFAFFNDLVETKELDLSNVTLFLPPAQKIEENAL